MTRVRRRGRCADLMGSPGGGGRDQELRAAAPPPPLPPPPRSWIPRPPERPSRPRRARDAPGPGPPLPAPPCGTSALRSVRGSGRPPRPISFPRSLRGLSLRRAERPGGARGGSEPGGLGGRRRRSPQPAAPPPLARLRSSAAAAAAGPHNGSGRAVTHPAPAGPAPTRGPPQDPTGPPTPSPAPHALPRAAAPPSTPTIPRCTHHLAFSLPSPQEPWRRPLRRRQPLQPWELSSQAYGSTHHLSSRSRYSLRCLASAPRHRPTFDLGSYLPGPRFPQRSQRGLESGCSEVPSSSKILRLSFYTLSLPPPPPEVTSPFPRAKVFGRNDWIPI